MGNHVLDNQYGVIKIDRTLLVTGSFCSIPKLHGDRFITNPEKVNTAVRWLAFKCNHMKSLVSSEKNGPSGFGALNILDWPQFLEEKENQSQCPHEYTQ